MYLRLSKYKGYVFRIFFIILYLRREKKGPPALCLLLSAVHQQCWRLLIVEIVFLHWVSIFRTEAKCAEWWEFKVTVNFYPPGTFYLELKTYFTKIFIKGGGGLWYPFLFFSLYSLLLPQSIGLNSTYLIQVYFTSYSLRLF